MPTPRPHAQLRILNITAQKPDSTGSGTYLAELVRCMDAAGHKTAVVCGIDRNDTISSLPVSTQVFPVRFNTDELPFNVCGMSDTMPYPSTRYRDMTPQMTRAFISAFCKALRQAAQEFKPDIVICHHLYLVTALARNIMPNVPMAAICHSTDLRQMHKHALERERIIDGIQRLDAILALHAEQVEEIASTYGVARDRVSIIGVGFNAQKFSMPPVRILYAGKICRKKGVESLLEAIDLMDPTAFDCANRGIELVLAGGHSADKQEYQRIVERSARCHWPVRFLGKLDQASLAQEYQTADIFVLPSFFEGLPLVVIEALACGCRVVTTDLPGERPWIESNTTNAPVTWVKPPRLVNVDEPLEQDLPAFEHDLAIALATTIKAAAASRPSCDVSGLSWEHVTERALMAVLQCRP